ncbi:MAG: glycoside hydrolase family 2 TIM barrel-domain containing protein, partial [Christensenellaceae bacterium]
MVPMYGFTHRFNKQRCLDIIKRLAISNMNLLRIWGGGVPYDDSFYEQCDKLGIMIYQDFYLSWSYYPDTEAFRINYRKEAEYHVKRLKHHPSILLWSGGNETYMHNEENTYEKYDFGYACFREDFAWACKTYDPDRFYLESSPCGGDYPSDPSEGDGHPLYYTYRHSVEKYPVFVSESARTSTGPLRSLKQFMSEDEIWPKDYINQVTYPSTLKNREKYFSTDEKFFVPLWKKVPIPETWGKWGASFFAGESAAIEKFYEAHDAESLVYRYNMAYADFMKTYSECVRRGKPYHDLSGNRRSTGYLLWKINDTWPQFYCSLIDYFLEVYIPFYQVKRSFAPVLLSFEVDDHILLWGVNDTDKDICGNVTIKGFSMSYNRTMGEFTVPVFIRAGESKVLTDLDPICPIIREWAIFAQLVDNDNNVISR